MLGFLIFAAGSISKHVVDQYNNLDEKEREELSKEMKELREIANDTVTKGKTLVKNAVNSVIGEPKIK